MRRGRPPVSIAPRACPHAQCRCEGRVAGRAIQIPHVARAHTCPAATRPAPPPSPTPDDPCVKTHAKRLARSLPARRQLRPAGAVPAACRRRASRTGVTSSHQDPGRARCRTVAPGRRGAAPACPSWLRAICGGHQPMMLAAGAGGGVRLSKQCRKRCRWVGRRRWGTPAHRPQVVHNRAHSAPAPFHGRSIIARPPARGWPCCRRGCAREAGAVVDWHRSECAIVQLPSDFPPSIADASNHRADSVVDVVVDGRDGHFLVPLVGVPGLRGALQAAHLVECDRLHPRHCTAGNGQAGHRIQQGAGSTRQ